MEYQTPGVYVREVDSGPKPIAAAATSIPGFLGIFQYKPRIDAIAITGSTADETVTARLLPTVVDSKGMIAVKNTDGAVDELRREFDLRPGKARDFKSLLELNRHVVTISSGPGDTVKISDKEGKSVSVSSKVLDTKGQVLVADQDVVATVWETIHEVFYLDQPKPKKAAELLEAYGVKFERAAEASLFDEYSVEPWPVTNRSQFFAWLKAYFAQYLVEENEVKDLIGHDIDDNEAAVDAVLAAIDSEEKLLNQFKTWLSQPSVFNFVTAVQGFYDNGGGKCYVYLMGVKNIEGSIRGDSEQKVGLHAFDDCEDMALHVAPGLSANQQKEMLEHCEIRKDRFAILDGPIVSLGNMPIPASDKGYGAMYVPWVKVTRPAWFVGDQEVDVPGALRRKLHKTSKNEVFVPPSGHVAGVMARVDTARGVHKAPANELVLGITGLSQTINKLEQGEYNERGINVIRDFKDRGTRIWGARTLATKSDPSWKYINVRRLFIMIEQSILVGSQWAVFEPNDRFLWSKLDRDLRSFLMRVWRSGALFGKTAEDAFFVQCDEETNPREAIDAGQVNVRIGIAPVKPAEFVVFSIGQWDGGSNLAE
jgi:phage tail sheath protein FI